MDPGNSKREPTVKLSHHCIPPPPPTPAPHPTHPPGGSELSSPWSSPVRYCPHTGLPHKFVSALKTRTKSYFKHRGPRLNSVELILATPHWCSDSDTLWGSTKKSSCHLQMPFKTSLSAPISAVREEPGE